MQLLKPSKPSKTAHVFAAMKTKPRTQYETAKARAIRASQEDMTSAKDAYLVGPKLGEIRGRKESNMGAKALGYTVS